METELTDEEVDFLLREFDKTDEAVQRRIVAALIADRKIFRSALLQIAKSNPPDLVAVAREALDKTRRGQRNRS